MPPAETAAANSHPGAVVIDWYAEGDVVTVIPRDQKRLSVHKDRVIHLLQLSANASSQLELLFQILASWVDKHHAQVDRAILTLRDERFSFLAVSRDPELNDALEDAISELDFAVANDPDLALLPMNAMVLPPASPEALDSFLDDRFMVVYCGKRS